MAVPTGSPTRRIQGLIKTMEAVLDMIIKECKKGLIAEYVEANND